MKDNIICSKCGSTKVVSTCRRVCCDCGYIDERWVSNKEDLELIYNTYR